MKITNRQLINDSMNIAAISNKELPVRISYALAKNISKLEKELSVYNKEKEKLIEKYSVKDEKGQTKIDEHNQIKIQEEYLSDWNKDINELKDIEIEVDIHKFKLDDLIGYNMTPAELMSIDYMIEG